MGKYRLARAGLFLLGFGAMIVLGPAEENQTIKRQPLSLMLADLTVSIGRGPDHAYPGQVFSQTRVLVRNIGKTKAENFTVGLGLKTPSSGEADFSRRIVRQTQLVKSLEAGESRALDFAGPMVIPGTAIMGEDYALGAGVDLENRVKESNEQNNRDSHPFKIWAEIEPTFGQTADSSPPFLRLHINGKGFENRVTKPNIKVFFGSHLVTQTGGNRTIIYGYPPQNIPAGRHYDCFLTDLQDRPLSNKVRFWWAYVMREATPQKGSPGTVVHIAGYNLGGTPGMKEVHFTTNSDASGHGPHSRATILSWSNQQLTVEAPQVPAGHYFVSLCEKGKKVNGCYVVVFDIL